MIATILGHILLAAFLSSLTFALICLGAAFAGWSTERRR